MTNLHLSFTKFPDFSMLILFIDKRRVFLKNIWVRIPTKWELEPKTWYQIGTERDLGEQIADKRAALENCTVGTFIGSWKAKRRGKREDNAKT